MLVKSARICNHIELILFFPARHDLSDTIVTDLLTVNGYRNSTAAPVPDALLINGVVSPSMLLALQHKLHNSLIIGRIQLLLGH
jgi:hypothetical protein